MRSNTKKFYVVSSLIPEKSSPAVNFGASQKKNIHCVHNVGNIRLRKYKRRNNCSERMVDGYHIPRKKPFA
jgi:hypothetical protein